MHVHVRSAERGRKVGENLRAAATGKWQRQQQEKGCGVISPRSYREATASKLQLRGEAPRRRFCLNSAVPDYWCSQRAAASASAQQ